MRHRWLGSAGAPALGIVTVLLPGIPAAGQTQAAAGAETRAAGTAWMTPRTPWGHPDLRGTWSTATLTPLERPGELAEKKFLTDAEAAEFEERTLRATNQDRRDGAGTDADVARAYNDFWWDRGRKVTANRRTSLVVDPPDGKIPALTPEAEKRQAARAEARRESPADNPEDRSPWERCITRGLPNVMLPGPYNNNYEIFQTPAYVVILAEMIHDARIIPLDGRPHLPPGVRQWMGDSVGRWEGDSLVVETRNFTDKTSFRGSGGNLRLVERFTRVAADLLDYSVTIDDPATFTGPWTVELQVGPSEGPIYEYSCHEANYGLEGILKGARAQEQARDETARRR